MPTPDFAAMARYQTCRRWAAALLAQSIAPDAGIILIWPTSSKCRATWADFRAANAESLSDADFAEIAEAIAVPFCSYELGGGAVPVVHVMLAAT
jgi:hypothetical protein